MGFLNKHSDFFVFLAACILLSSFLINDEVIKGIGFVCSAILAVPSAISIIYNLIKYNNGSLCLSFESHGYWVGIILIAAALLYNDGYSFISLVLLILCVINILFSILYSIKQSHKKQ
jgi:hypothetical protein